MQTLGRLVVVQLLPQAEGTVDGDWGESGARYLGGAVPVQSAGLAGGRPSALQCVVAGIGKALGMAATLRQIWEENKVPHTITPLPLA